MRLVDPAPTLPLPDALAGLATAPDPAAHYRSLVFPHAVARFRALGERRPPCALLLLPVGTQPYAPLLSALANPTSNLALLVTPQTRGYAAEVAACFPHAAHDQFDIGDGTSARPSAARSTPPWPLRPIPGRPTWSST